MKQQVYEFFSSLLFLLQNLDYTRNTHFHMCKFIFYAINNVLNENIIIFYFVVIILSLKSQNAKKKYKEKSIRIKKPKKEEVTVDNNKENVYEKIILQHAKHDDNIDLELIRQDDEKILLFWFIYHVLLLSLINLNVHVINIS